LQNKPNSRSAKTNATFFAAKVYESKPPLATRRKRTQSNPTEPNRTQFQNGQNEDKRGNGKGLCKSTTNNEQRTLSKTNPNEPKRTQFIQTQKNAPKPLPRKALWKNFVPSTPKKRTQSKPISVPAARFIVANLAGQPQQLYDEVYCRRGKAENREIGDDNLSKSG